MRPGPASLPDPDPAALERSRRLAARIAREIEAAGGGIGFDRFMQLALYAPSDGYYTGESPIFGRDGDFVTAPEQGDLFARCLARQCIEVLARTAGRIVEYGAGSGRLAQCLLRILRAEDRLPERYLIVEPSPALERRQRALLEGSEPALAARVSWCRGHPDTPIEGIVIANEVVDAMPVKRFVVARGGPRELGVAVHEAGFGWRVLGPLTLPFIDLQDGRGIPGSLPDGYVSEFVPGLGRWIGELRGIVKKGAVLVIDYGYPRHEYLHPSRSGGTLKCHYRHLVHDDPFFHPGLQDITAAVDFTAIAEHAVEAGFAVAGFTTQTRFLLACGLDTFMSGQLVEDPGGHVDRVQEAKLLLLPSEMGQTCKVMALTAGYDEPLGGFEHDERHRLSGFDTA